ncbi:MAG TPA: formyltetrahydrofolate deformylase [Solirubrobacteraceae bacterium]|nr:formyltetrahydrofolate deformylase [Solirubrobacteraceae bacterium]
MTAARLLVRCPNRRGIIAAISNFILDRGGDIRECSQYASGPTFFQRTVFATPALDEQLERDFQRDVAERFGMQWWLTDPSRPKRVAILVSRYDHCLLDLLWRSRRGELPIDVGVVVSNHPDLADAVAGFGIPYEHVPVTPETKPQAEQRQLELVRGRYDLIVLARYMQVLSPGFLDAVGIPLINIHHSFLPSFAGANPYQRARERGVKLIGATAHYVTEELDEGPIIEQGIVRVTHRDEADELARRGADVERTVLARAVGWHCEDRVLRDGRTTVVL